MAHILIVDDDTVNSQLYSNKLQTEGHVVDLIADGFEAQKVVGTKYDLILLDVMIPGTDGISLLKEFKAAANKQTPVIMFTNLMNDETKKVVEENGATALMYKVDTTPQALIKKIHEYIGEPAPVTQPAQAAVPPKKEEATVKPQPTQPVQPTQNTQESVLEDAAK